MFDLKTFGILAGMFAATLLLLAMILPTRSVPTPTYEVTAAPSAPRR
jgi:hypothetical protein